VSVPHLPLGFITLGYDFKTKVSDEAGMYLVLSVFAVPLAFAESWPITISACCFGPSYSSKPNTMSKL